MDDDSKRPNFAVTYLDIIKGQFIENPEIKVDPSKGTALYFTSGTTGTPKAILLTHNNLEYALYRRKQVSHHHQTYEDNFYMHPAIIPYRFPNALVR